MTKPTGEMKPKHGIRLPGMIVLWLLPFAVTVTTSRSAPPSTTTSTTQAPWEKQREISMFQNLLKHSPFSLPTAEESSPLAERYAITGIVTIDGEERIFVFDRTDQSRELLTHRPNKKNMSLVALVREGSARPLKASVRVGGQTGTIGFLEASAQPAQPAGPPAPGSAASINQPTGPRLPPLPTLPQQRIGPVPAQTGPGVPPGRRIIRRPVISPPHIQPAVQ